MTFNSTVLNRVVILIDYSEGPLKNVVTRHPSTRLSVGGEARQGQGAFLRLRRWSLKGCHPGEHLKKII